MFNGDVGTVETIDAGASELTVRFDGRELTWGWGELDKLVPPYACTIHNSQGSTYPAVVIPLLTQHYARLRLPCHCWAFRSQPERLWFSW